MSTYKTDMSDPDPQQTQIKIEIVPRGEKKKTFEIQFYFKTNEQASNFAIYLMQNKFHKKPQTYVSKFETSVTIRMDYNVNIMFAESKLVFLFPYPRFAKDWRENFKLCKRSEVKDDRAVRADKSLELISTWNDTALAGLFNLASDEDGESDTQSTTPKKPSRRSSKDGPSKEDSVYPRNKLKDGERSD